MSNKYFNDQLDILIYNYFTNKIDYTALKNIVNKTELSYDDLKDRFLWLQEMNIDPNKINLSENHQLIYEIFDNCNIMFNENNIEYYYTSGILSYILVDKKLQRYHHDLDIFVNMKDLDKLENICNKYNFVLQRKLGDRNDGTKRVMLKMYYRNFIEIPITIFMYVRKKDGSIEQNDYFISDDDFYVEKIYNSQETSNLSFSNVLKFHNGIKYFAITLEALYLSKIGNRKKDIYDCLQFKDYLNKNNTKILREEIMKNEKNKIFAAKDDAYYDFIFSKFKRKTKVLKK